MRYEKENIKEDLTLSIPRSFSRDGERFDRVTIHFAGGPAAPQARAFVHEGLICAHGFRTARRLTKALAISGGKFRTFVARRVVKALVSRLRLLIDAKLITVFVAGRRVRPAS